MPKSAAWLLDLGGPLRAAVGARQMLHAIDAPRLLELPEMPSHCGRVLIWEDDILPVMDLGALLGVPAASDAPVFAGITAYQEQPGAPTRHGALCMAGMPARIEVGDDQACGLPDRPTGWKRLAMSCFVHHDQAVPILDLSYIFSNALVTDR